MISSSLSSFCDGAINEIRMGIIKKPESCSIKAQRGDKLVINYTGKYGAPNWQNVVEFDSSFKEKPFEYVQGDGKLVFGLDTGILSMCKGEKRRMVIPPLLGYGDKGLTDIVPPRATLFFDVELLEIIRKSKDEL